MIPKQAEIEIPLLEALVELGGQAKPKEVYLRVAAKFPQLTDEDLATRLTSGEKKWTNRIQWARQHLMAAGHMESPQWGTWAITEQGRQRVAQAGKTRPDALRETSTTSSLVDLYETYDLQFRSKLLDKLHELTPKHFEHFARDLLAAYGFIKVVVTQLSNDGGIDGYGLLKVGLAHMNVAFQCKRWEANVPRPEIDKFRGAISGEYEQGIFFTTSDFSKQSMEVSIKKGTVPIILVNGEGIVDMMIEKEFGVQKRPLQIYEDQIDTIFGDDD